MEQCKQNQGPTPQPKKKGRRKRHYVRSVKRKKPRKPRKRLPRRFDEVPLGHALRLYAPLEYDLIFRVSGIGCAPDADLIEAISYSSINPYFKTERFRYQLIKYRIEGCHSEHPIPPPTPQQLARAKAARQKLIQNSAIE